MITFVDYLTEKIRKDVIESLRGDFIPSVAASYKIDAAGLEKLLFSTEWVGAAKKAGVTIPADIPASLSPPVAAGTAPAIAPESQKIVKPRAKKDAEPPTKFCEYIGTRGPTNGKRCQTGIKTGFFCSTHAKTAQAATFEANGNCHPDSLLLAANLHPAQKTKAAKNPQTPTRLAPVLDDSDEENENTSETATSTVPVVSTVTTPVNNSNDDSMEDISDIEELSDIEDESSTASNTVAVESPKQTPVKPVKTAQQPTPPTVQPVQTPQVASIKLQDLVKQVAATKDEPESGSEDEVSDQKDLVESSSEDETPQETGGTGETEDTAETEETAKPEKQEESEKESEEETEDAEDAEDAEDQPSEPRAQDLKWIASLKNFVDQSTNFVFKKKSGSTFVIAKLVNSELADLDDADRVTIKKYGWEELA